MGENHRHVRHLERKGPIQSHYADLGDCRLREEGPTLPSLNLLSIIKSMFLLSNELGRALQHEDMAADVAEAMETLNLVPPMLWGFHRWS